MSINQRGWSSGFIVLASVVLLAGCATAAPADEPQPSDPGPIPSAEEAVAVAALSIGATAVSTLDDAGVMVASLPYTTTGLDAIAFLTDAIGSEPVIAPRPGDSSCVADATQASWGGGEFVLVYDYPERTGLPDGQTVSIEAKSATVGDLAVQTSGGFGIGSPVNDFVAAIPGVGTHAHASATADFFVDYDVASGEYEDMDDADFGMTGNAYWGAQAASAGSVITKLSAPSFFQSAC